jgi:putative SOS response-associated peptidase YedK
MLDRMCGRFAQQRPASELAERFAAEPLVDDSDGRFNVAPTDEAHVVVQRDDRRAVTAYRWGLIPHWAESAKAGARAFNARAETVASSPLFRDLFRRKRCLVPVEAFYEWRRDGTRRQPFAIRRADGDLLVLAGLWSGWRDTETAEVRRTFTIVTSAASPAIADLHDRMPVILDPEAWSRWLDPAAADASELLGLLVPNETAPLELYPVRRLVNDVRNDGAELLRPLDA